MKFKQYPVTRDLTVASISVGYIYIGLDLIILNEFLQIKKFMFNPSVLFI